jgi:hypothetical protein
MLKKNKKGEEKPRLVKITAKWNFNTFRPFHPYLPEA